MTKDNIDKNGPSIATNVDVPRDTPHLEQEQKKLSVLGKIMLNKKRYSFTMLFCLMSDAHLYTLQ